MGAYTSRVENTEVNVVERGGTPEGSVDGLTVIVTI
jgi:hypothetical protein